MHRGSCTTGGICPTSIWRARSTTGALGEIGAGRTEFVMRASNVEYHAPARFDDLLEVYVRVSRIGQSSVTYEYAAYKIGTGDAEQLMVTATQVNVLIDHDDRSTVPVPDSFRRHVREFEGADL